MNDESFKETKLGFSRRISISNENPWAKTKTWIPWNRKHVELLVLICVNCNVLCELISMEITLLIYHCDFIRQRWGERESNEWKKKKNKNNSTYLVRKLNSIRECGEWILNAEMEETKRGKDERTDNIKHELEWKIGKNLLIKSILKMTFWKVDI